MPKKVTSKISQAKPARLPSMRGPPVALSSVSQVSRPKYSPSKSDGSIRVSRTEFSGSLTNGGTTGFALTQLSASQSGYDLNPACSFLFPWLSAVAQSYERFKFHSLQFRLIPSQATTTAGRVYAAVDYDFDDTIASSKTALMSNQTVQEAPVWETIILKCDPAQLHPDMPFKYVTGTTRNNFVEPRTAYCGFLMVAFDTPTTNLLYDLEVQYDVTLSVPVLEPSGSLDGYASAPSGTQTIGTNASTLYTPYVTPITSQPVAGIKTVVPGVPGVPLLVVPGTTISSPSAVDLLMAPKDRGSFMAGINYGVAATPPNALLGTDQPQVKFAVYDALGSLLSTISDQALKAVGGSFPKTGGWTSAGSILGNTLSVGLSDLFTSYPSARYLVPLLFSSTVRPSLSGVASGYKMEL